MKKQLFLLALLSLGSLRAEWPNFFPYFNKYRICLVCLPLSAVSGYILSNRVSSKKSRKISSSTRGTSHTLSTSGVGMRDLIAGVIFLTSLTMTARQFQIP